MLTAVAFQSFYVRLSKIKLCLAGVKRAKVVARCNQSFFWFCFGNTLTDSFFVKIRFAGSFTKIRVACNPAQTALFVVFFDFRHLQCFFLPVKVAVSLKKQIFPLEN